MRPLVTSLLSQVKACDEHVDIVCLDDGSQENYRILNRELAANCHYEELPQNIGRSRIRNLFREKVSPDTEYMLFIDCDLLTIDNLFVNRYLESFREKPQVVVGGHVYSDQPADREYHLHYINGVSRVSKDAESRRKNPNRSFMTGNFAIRRDLFLHLGFDESIVGYGHEDTLMGYRLQQDGVVITHIPNPLLASDLDTNALFLEKTRTSIENLVKISLRLSDPQFDRAVSLLRFSRVIERLRLSGLVRYFFRLFQTLLERNLQEGRGGVRTFLIYKLGYCLCQIPNQQ